MAAGTGLRVGGDAISETRLHEVLLALHPGGGRPRGEDWDRCPAQQATIERWLKDGLRLTKIRKLLARQGLALPYPTPHRFAVVEIGFGRTAPTMPVADAIRARSCSLKRGGSAG